MDVGTIVDEGLGNASYVVDLGDGRALAVDPGRDPTPYVEAARRFGSTIAFVAETHLHADFVSGARELQATGATVLASAGAELAFPHQPLRDDERVDLGGLTLRAIATPGHTPEHLSYELLDGSVPLGVFTGGSLLRGSVARTDLISPEQTEPLARALFGSIHDRLLDLPDDLPVHPTHGAGETFCSVTPTDDGDPTTTIGRERRTNPLLRAPDDVSFARELLGTYGTYPDYFLRLRAVNRAGPRVFGASPPRLEPLGLERVRAEVDAGATLIDARPIEGFARGHVPGALAISLRPAFATWLGWLVPAPARLVFVLDPAHDRDELVRRCLQVGYEDLAGELDGGMETWRRAGLEEERSPLLEPGDTLAGTLVDVRQDQEWVAGHLPGSVHLELGDLAARAASLPAGPLTMICGAGERATTAASVLERLGRTDVSVVHGGVEDVARTASAPLRTGVAP